MKIFKIAIVAVLMSAMCSGALSAQRSESKGWFFEFGGAALVPQTQPVGLGAAVAGGYSARDINILFRPEALFAQAGLTQNILLIPTFLFEVKIGILPGFITLLPYINAGAILAKVKRSDGTLGSAYAYTYYAEVGVGAEISLTHEISFVPRIGVASALLSADTDSNNHSGLSLSLSMRYAFGRSKALDY